MTEEKNDKDLAAGTADKQENEPGRETTSSIQEEKIKNDNLESKDISSQQEVAAQNEAEMEDNATVSKDEEPAEKEAGETSAAIPGGDLNHLAEPRSDLPVLRTGDVIKVSYRVVEGGKERTQIFEGTVIAAKGTGISRTITVRKTSFGIAVERIFPLHSKLVQKIEVKKHSKVRRAKLYYLRKLKGKAARLKELR